MHQSQGKSEQPSQTTRSKLARSRQAAGPPRRWMQPGLKPQAHLPALLVPLHALRLRGLLDDPRHVSVLRDPPHLGHVLVPGLPVVATTGKEKRRKPTRRQKGKAANQAEQKTPASEQECMRHDFRCMGAWGGADIIGRRTGPRRSPENTLSVEEKHRESAAPIRSTGAHL